MRKIYLGIFAMLMSVMLLAGCSTDAPDPVLPPGENSAPDASGNGRIRTVLVYAIASNNLSSDFNSDRAEMIEGMKNVDLKKYSLLLYRVLKNGNVTLSEVQDTGEGFDFVTIKEYDNNVLSTDPRRIAEVLADMKALRPARDYGMVFWGHGSAWEPMYSDHYVDNPIIGGRTMHPSMATLPEENSFGGDETQFVRDWTDLHEIADAIPDNSLQFIWFDNCFMSSIEVVYQLRNKARYMVAYPTEIYSAGMPYNDTMPLIMREQPDLIGAAQETFNYYNFTSDACTVCVMDLSEIENVAEAAKKANKKYAPLDVAGLQKYSRFSYGPYYDFTQYTKRMGQTSDTFSSENFDAAMSKFVLYKACSQFDFTNTAIDPSNYSGISTHAFGVKTTNDNYYKTLDWYKRVIEPNVAGIKPIYP